jgi:hypothetical protein
MDGGSTPGPSAWGRIVAPTIVSGDTPITNEATAHRRSTHQERAPTLQKSRTLSVGYDEATYKRVLGGKEDHDVPQGVLSHRPLDTGSRSDA